MITRFVGKEFADDTKKGELFSGTPGLPALRYLVSKLATYSHGEARSSVAFVDVKSAFLYGRARRPFFIEVPAEDPRSQEEGMLAKLIGSLYGTRDAPLIWQDCLRNEMKRLGFVESLRVPCLFFHAFMNVEMIFHVDDLFVVGPLENVKKVYHGLAESFEMKCKNAGPETGNKRSTWDVVSCSLLMEWRSMVTPNMRPFC